MASVATLPSAQTPREVSLVDVHPDPLETRSINVLSNSLVRLMMLVLEMLSVKEENATVLLQMLARTVDVSLAFQLNFSI